MDLIKWLEEWYLSLCNGDWEHCYGIKIGNIDNPGWSVDIDLENTYLEDVEFKEIEENRNENDWFFCRIKQKVFQGRGGAKNLGEILTIFKNWAESNE